jgi:hypothetical protein
LKFFEAIKTLFPRSRAFELFIENDKRKMMKAIAVLPEDIRHEAELVYMDLFPDTTRCPEKWESAFAVYFTAKELPKRRNVLESLWKINNGGQSASFLQDVLESMGDIKVVENVPVINPFQIYQSLDLAVCDNEIMVCDFEEAVCDYRLGDQGFEPSVLRNDTSSFYSIPADPAYWSTCFFVCKEAWKDGNNNIIYVELLEMSITWKNYIEYLILKTKPVHSTAVVFIDWKQQEMENDQN